MIQQFKRKTIGMLVLILWGVLVGILLTLNVSNHQSNRLQAKRLLLTQDKIIKDESQDEVNPPLVNGQELTHIYTVKIIQDKDWEVTYPTHIAEEQNKTLLSIAEQMQKEGEKEGYYRSYYYIVSTIEGKHISFLDYSIWKQQESRMLIYSLLIGGALLVILFFFACFLGEWLTKPITAAFLKQKQFISDAGHELKTPLTVVQASLELLENDLPGNKYITYIREENTRMTELAKDLLLLTHLEDKTLEPCMEPLNLSKCLTGAALPFESVAFEQGGTLDLQIHPDLVIRGEEKQLRKMIEVLLDNALKHVDTGGTVRVTLNQEKTKVILRVSNEGEAIPEEEQKKIFDRFYRVDQARDRKEGRYGLGLAIASAIVEVYKAKISVNCNNHWTTFAVKFQALAGKSEET